MYRFLPLFFVFGGAIEWFMIHANIGGETFCKLLSFVSVCTIDIEIEIQDKTKIDLCHKCNVEHHFELACNNLG